jgi:steroid 5-alpha reductase family enzyme
MEGSSFFLLSTAVVMTAVTLLWLLSLAIRDSSIVDIAWGMLFVLVAWLGVAVGPGDPTRRWLVAVLVTVWGIRLSVRIGRRNIGRPEDFRYAAWRERAGNAWWWRSLFKVFWLQGAVAVVVSLPLVAVAVGTTPEGLTAIDILGIAVWLTGFGFEAVGDHQLDRFKANPANRGGIIETGLWRYTRHPNYFGDALLWWGLGVIGLLTPWGLPALVGPALMTFLLVRVSGVAMLESSMSTRPGWDRYAASTSAFIPRPPRPPVADS